MSRAAFVVMMMALAATPAQRLELESPKARLQPVSLGQEKLTVRSGASKCVEQKTFFGKVERGQDFKSEIGHGLIFYLMASHDPVIEGWRIEILPKKPWAYGSGPDYAGWLNPPYHYYNATDVNVSYDVNAKDAIHYNPRTLRFPVSQADALKAIDLVETLESTTGPRFDEALKAMQTMRSGKAVFRILASQLGESGPENQHQGRIEWLKFELVVTFPCSVASEKP